MNTTIKAVTPPQAPFSADEVRLVAAFRRMSDAERIDIALKLTKVAASPELTLSANEIRLVLAYRRADNRMQNDALLVMDGWAEAFPRHTVPTLRLVTGRPA
jgi:hypothetical protein